MSTKFKTARLAVVVGFCASAILGGMPATVFADDAGQGLPAVDGLESAVASDPAEDAAEATISVGNKKYSTLKEAVDAASKSGIPVILNENITDSCEVLSGQQVVIDLNGKTLTATEESDAALLVLGGSLTVKDSSIQGKVPEVSDDYRIVDYAGSGKITAAKEAIRVFAEGELILESGSIDSTGSLAVRIGSGSKGSGRLVVNGGYIHAYSAAIACFAQGTTATINGGVIVSEQNAPLLGNGTSHGTEINVSGGTLISRCTTEGYIACGIYHPQAGSLNITGGDIYADGGVGVLTRAGTANITGGTITATGTKAGRVGDKSSNIPCSGVVVDHTNPDYPGMTESDVVSISGNVVIACDVTLPVVQTMAPEGESPKGSIVVFGGSFSGAVPNDLCAPGYESKDNGSGQFTVEMPVNKRVASIDDRYYLSLQDAIDSAPAGSVIKLEKNEVTENVTVPDGSNITIDLNGNTLSGGTVKGKAALTNFGTTVVTDSSSPSTGRIVREDTGVPAYYVIDNQGTMTIESGTVYNNSGNGQGSGSSLVRNLGKGADAKASLTIAGGKLQQDKFIVVKNDDWGVLSVTGGKIVTTLAGSDEKSIPSAIQNWGEASISGGNITGAIWTSVWSDDFPASTTTISGEANVTGTILVKVDASYKGENPPSPELAITGGDVNTKGYGWAVDANSKVGISGGVFDERPNEEFFEDGFGLGKPDANGNFVAHDKTYFTVKCFFEKKDSLDAENLNNYVEDVEKIKMLEGIPGDAHGVVAGDDDFIGFDGFKVSATDETLASDGTTVVQAYYKREVYRVAFSSNGLVGDVPAEQQVKFEGKVTTPSNPVREGHTFLGWFEVGAQKPFNFDSAVTSNLMLEARWSENKPSVPDPVETHKVTFVPIVGGEEKIVREVEDGKFVDLPKTPVCEGYTFAGWFFDKDFKKPFKAEENAITADLTLYGGWYENGGKDPVPPITPQKPVKPALKPELPQAGDDSMVPIVALGLGGFAVIAAGAVLSRKNKK